MPLAAACCLASALVHRPWNETCLSSTCSGGSSGRSRTAASLGDLQCRSKQSAPRLARPEAAACARRHVIACLAQRAQNIACVCCMRVLRKRSWREGQRWSSVPADSDGLWLAPSPMEGRHPTPRPVRRLPAGVREEGERGRRWIPSCRGLQARISVRSDQVYKPSHPIVRPFLIVFRRPSDGLPTAQPRQWVGPAATRSAP